MPSLLGRRRSCSHPRNLARVVTLLVLGILLPGSPSSAAEGEEAAKDGWQPALAAVGGMVGEDAKGSVDSSARGSYSSHETLLYPMLGLDAELMSPALAAVPGSPRLFLDAGAMAAFDSSRNAVKEGSPGEITLPQPAVPGGPVPVAGITGLGSALRSQVQPFVFRAGAGLAFALRVRERTVRIKPAVVYRMDTTKAKTVVKAAESINDNGLCPCAIADFVQSKSQAAHWLGGGLEVEMDAHRAGPFMASVFLGVQGYALVSDSSINLQATSQFDDGTPLTVSSSFSRDPWSCGGTLGIRFRWLPD